MATTTALPAQRRSLVDVLAGAANVMVSFGLALSWGIVLILLGVAWLLRLVLTLERWRARAVHDLPVPDLSTWPPQPRDGAIMRSLRPFTNGEYWRSFAHHALKMMLGLAAGAVFIWLA